MLFSRLAALIIFWLGSLSNTSGSTSWDNGYLTLYSGAQVSDWVYNVPPGNYELFADLRVVGPMVIDPVAIWGLGQFYTVPVSSPDWVRFTFPISITDYYSSSVGVHVIPGEYTEFMGVGVDQYGLLRDGEVVYLPDYWVFDVAGGTGCDTFLDCPGNICTVKATKTPYVKASLYFGQSYTEHMACQAPGDASCTTSLKRLICLRDRRYPCDGCSYSVAFDAGGHDISGGYIITWDDYFRRESFGDYYFRDDDSQGGFGWACLTSSLTYTPTVFEMQNNGSYKWWGVQAYFYDTVASNFCDDDGVAEAWYSFRVLASSPISTPTPTPTAYATLTPIATGTPTPTPTPSPTLGPTPTPGLVPTFTPVAPVAPTISVPGTGYNDNFPILPWHPDPFCDDWCPVDFGFSTRDAFNLVIFPASFIRQVLAVPLGALGFDIPDIQDIVLSVVSIDLRMSVLCFDFSIFLYTFVAYIVASFVLRMVQK